MGKDNQEDIKNWMGTFASGTNMKSVEFIKTYQGKEYLFIVSSVKYGNYSNSYLISYVPNEEDNILINLMLSI